MSHRSVGFWTRCWRAIFGAGKQSELAISLPLLVDGAGAATTAAADTAGPVMPDGTTVVAAAATAPATLPAALVIAHAANAEAAVAPYSPSAVMTVAVSAEILTLPSGAGRRYLLAARLASIHNLNPPKHRARKAAPHVCTTKPLPKRASAPTSMVPSKRRPHVSGPRVQRPAAATAKIIHLAAHRQAAAPKPSQQPARRTA